MCALRAELVDKGFQGSASRLDALTDWLISREFTCVQDLACVGPIMDLDGADALPCADIAFVIRLERESARHFECGALSSTSTRNEAGSVGLVQDLPPAVAERIDNAIAVCASRSCQSICVAGPRNTLKRLRSEIDFDCVEQRRTWIEGARTQALLGSCPRSIASFKSGLRCYMNFASDVLGMHGRELPPSVEGLLAWSGLFRCAETYSNYLAHVRLGCELVGASSAALDHPSIRRAKFAIRKRLDFIPRKRLFIRLSLLERMMEYAVGPRIHLVMLFLTCYTFLLRLPSEGLPIRFGRNGNSNEQHRIWLESDALLLRLPRRKNRDCESTLRRQCWCATSPRTCPIHVLAAFFATFLSDAKPFGSISAAGALAGLREILTDMGIKDAGIFRTHDFRRGHARDLQSNGSTLRDILLAGDWRSPAFMQYLDAGQLEDDAILEAHEAESSEEE